MAGQRVDDGQDDDTEETDGATFTDDELAAMALEAEWFDPFGPEVEQFGGPDPTRFPLLPEWYMPAPGIARSRSRAAVMFAFAVALVVINVGGFCVTWGWPDFVWKG